MPTTKDHHVTLKSEQNGQPHVAEVVYGDDGQPMQVLLPGNGVAQSPGSFDIGAEIPKPGTGPGSVHSTHTTVRSQHVDVSNTGPSAGTAPTGVTGGSK
ncbi:hypothetical protein SAMN02799622_01344 [Methylobacterium sp. UNC378MF]|uniref:hypothetical protein n=1 Tax=Methylobacterium sp. UNC378MF TaxID=1502748 RepID=UPI00088A0A2E|nr:hypothetical protein [Methylobacterium sp. UNC378MF]SDA15601.1 hypothetical protein SAMN02799622_01344 [Methylobacterium sp. UNC378MF]